MNYEQQMQAGLAGLHTYDCWEADPEHFDHDMCREIVAAVLNGLNGLVQQETPA